MPYAGMSNQKVWVSVADGYRLPQPSSTSGGECLEIPRCLKAFLRTLLDAMYKLMLTCWQAATGDRATFTTIVTSLQAGFQHTEPCASPKSVSTMSSPKLKLAQHSPSLKLASSQTTLQAGVALDGVRYEHAGHYDHSAHYDHAVQESPYDEATAREQVPTESPDASVFSDEHDYTPLAEQLAASGNIYDAESVDALSESSHRGSFELVVGTKRGSVNTCLSHHEIETSLYDWEDEFVPAGGGPRMSSGPQPPPPRNGMPSMQSISELRDVGYVDVETAADAPPSLVDNMYSCNEHGLQAGIEDQLRGVSDRVNPIYSSSRAVSITVDPRHRFNAMDL